MSNYHCAITAYSLKIEDSVLKSLWVSQTEKKIATITILSKFISNPLVKCRSVSPSVSPLMTSFRPFTASQPASLPACPEYIVPYRQIRLDDYTIDSSNKVVLNFLVKEKDQSGCVFKTLHLNRNLRMGPIS